MYLALTVYTAARKWLSLYPPENGVWQQYRYNNIIHVSINLKSCKVGFTVSQLYIYICISIRRLSYRAAFIARIPIGRDNNIISHHNSLQNTMYTNVLQSCVELDFWTARHYNIYIPTYSIKTLYIPGVANLLGVKCQIFAIKVLNIFHVPKRN